MVIAINDEKQNFNFIKSNTENSRSIKQLLTDLISRGFNYEDGLLCVIDGAKGLRKAIEEVFGRKAVIQRCQWHKRENVLSYLKESDKEVYKKKLNRAYATEDYLEAKLQLEDIIEELRGINVWASESLEEGPEETLTIHRLCLKADFGKSFSTTNIIENFNSQLVKYIGRVKYWKTSDQCRRWVAGALMEIELKMRRVDNFSKIENIKDAIRKEIEKRNQ